jgi:CNT family concentrative nucleoside transporter
MAVVSEILQQLQGLVGIVIITLGAWTLSEDRRGRPSFRWILGALLMQVIVALLVVRVPFVWSVIGLANHAVAAIEKATLVGSSYMFG